MGQEFVKKMSWFSVPIQRDGLLNRIENCKGVCQH